MDKTEEMLELWCSALGIEFITAEAKEVYKKRTKRIADVIQLKVPDRVPYCPFIGFFPAKYAGITPGEAMYDYDKAYMAWKRFITDFQPDSILNYHYAFSGPVFEALSYKQLKWPGHGVDPNHTYQFIEGEYMKADEYEAFIEDPSDFIIRTYLPRTCGALEELKKLPPIHETISYYLGLCTATVPAIGIPEVAGAIESLLKAVKENFGWETTLSSFNKEMKGSGFPLHFSSGSAAPYDVIGDFFRGTRGIMIDMYRNPDRLLEAIKKVTPWMVQMGVSGSKAGRSPIVDIDLHKGADGFMSLEQFKTFYWPSLRAVMLGLIDEGLIPELFIEGDYTSRLEVIGDIPRGKVIYHFESTDIFKAKEVLGDHICIKGNVPHSLLCTGTPGEVKDYCKKLIDVVGKGGGFIMDAGACIDEAKIENIKAMTNFTKEYGTYQ